ncbi:MAG TPA: hypothetical protein QF753_23265 [Victivallales bacterium]|nr:hypothetical protein [Victivallales bacterium]
MDLGVVALSLAGDLSLAEDSGWRELDEESTALYVKMIKAGSWGATALRPPRLNNRKCSLVDGKYLLDDGKKITSAIVFLIGELGGEDKIKEMKEEDRPDWLLEPLYAIMCGEWNLEIVDYEGADESSRIAIQVLAHEQESNKFEPSSNYDKIKICKATWLNLSVCLLVVLPLSHLSVCSCG